MAEYYAVERSPEYLAHYGVRGMRWGVRRAIERGDSEALSRHYKKANRKLLKLSQNTNRDLMRIRYNNAKQNMAIGALSSGPLSAALTVAANSRAGIRNQLLYGSAAGLAGATAGALASSKGIMSGRYISDRGHAKAIQRRDQWQREMRDAFKGTKYRKGSMHDMLSNGLKEGISSYSGQGPMVVPLMKVGNPKSKSRSSSSMTAAQKNAYVQAHGKPTLNKSDARALSAIANGKVKPYKRRRS